MKGKGLPSGKREARRAASQNAVEKLKNLQRRPGYAGGVTKGARKEPGAGKRSKQTRPRKEIRGQEAGGKRGKGDSKEGARGKVKKQEGRVNKIFRDRGKDYQGPGRLGRKAGGQRHTEEEVKEEEKERWSRREGDESQQEMRRESNKRTV